MERSCLEQPDVVARGAGIGIGGESLSFRSAYPLAFDQLIYQDHALVRPAPCDIQGCSIDLRDAEGSFSSSVFHLSGCAVRVHPVRVPPVGQCPRVACPRSAWLGRAAQSKVLRKHYKYAYYWL